MKLMTTGSRKLKTITLGLAFALSSTALGAVITMGTTTQAFAQTSSVWYVWKNCTAYPCTIGVAVHGYAQPGSVNHSNGWRTLSQSYRDGNDAWRTACRYHYGNPRYNSPDIANGVIVCENLCNGNKSCQ